MHIRVSLWGRIERERWMMERERETRGGGERDERDGQRERGEREREREREGKSPSWRHGSRIIRALRSVSRLSSVSLFIKTLLVSVSLHQNNPFPPANLVFWWKWPAQEVASLPSDTLGTLKTEVRDAEDELEEERAKLHDVERKSRVSVCVLCVCVCVCVLMKTYVRISAVVMFTVSQIEEEIWVISCLDKLIRFR